MAALVVVAVVVAGAGAVTRAVRAFSSICPIVLIPSAPSLTKWCDRIFTSMSSFAEGSNR